jgi:hypothetical protein
MCAYTIKNKKPGSTGACVMKVDMYKAYDKVERVCLENMMMRLGFTQRWISLVMACVSSVRYQARFDSEETNVLIPT